MSDNTNIIILNTFAAEMVEAAYRSLDEKATNVYISRARQLYDVEPPRTSLFCWSLTDVKITALADRSYHGRDNVIRTMRNIDPER